MQLILGGARSGKTALAQSRAEALSQHRGAELVYVATGQAGDSEMRERIARHRADRAERWRTIEEPLRLADALGEVNDTQCVVVDCLTLWISNCLHTGCWPAERDKLLALMGQKSRSQAPVHWLFVSNEVGSGVVPLGNLSREFVDASGWLHQALAGLCDSVTLVVAGLPLSLKGDG